MTREELIKNLMNEFPKTFLKITLAERVADYILSIQSKEQIDWDGLTNESLCYILDNVAMWVKKENNFIPFEYLGMFKELINEQSVTKELT